MAYDFRRIKVLVVDCQPSIFELLKGILNAFTVQPKNIFPAFTAEEAYDKFCMINHHLIIVDWLEDPNGTVDLTRLIRTHKRSPNPFVPIIMTAGSAHEKRVLRARDAGISEYLVKPFTAGALAERITRVVEDQKKFVVSDHYTGPDRRVSTEEYTGVERREDSSAFKASKMRREVDSLRAELEHLQEDDIEDKRKIWEKALEQMEENSRDRKIRAEKMRQQREEMFEEAKLKEEKAKLQKRIQDLRKKENRSRKK